MAKTINLIRIANAKLVSADIDTLGVTFAAQSPYRADGFLKVNVTVANANPTQKMFLEGADFTIYAIGGNVTKLSAYSLSMFKKLEQVWLFSSTMVEIEETDNNAYLDYLKSSCVIYVPSNLISNYQTAYSNLSSKFVPINLDYTLTIVGTGTLTSEIITDQLINGTYNAQDRETCTKLVISGFDNYMDTLWGYNLSKVLPSLNNNVWYNAIEIDFTTRELEGVDELLESDITNLINGISSDKLSGVTQLKFSGFSDMSVALTYDYSALTNLEYVWLDNVRYEYLKAPNGYTFVDGVSADGNGQEVNTQRIGQNHYINIDFLCKNTSPNYAAITGCRSLDNAYLISKIASTIEYGAGERSLGSGLFNKKINVILDANGITVDGVYKGTASINGTDGIRLFNSGAYGSGASHSTIWKLITTNVSTGLVDGKFYAVKNLLTNKYGFYEFLNNEFYGNIGQNDLLGGEVTSIFENPTYFNPIADLVSEYDARYTQTFYLDYNGTLPSYPDYQLTYYTDINCTTSILPENMQSGTRYYVKAVMVTLTIQGSGTLTSAIVEPQVAKAGSGVTKVIVPVDFTTFENLCLDILDTYTPNVECLEINGIIPQISYIYSNANDKTKTNIRTLIINSTSITTYPTNSFALQNCSIFEHIRIPNITNASFYYLCNNQGNIALKTLEMPNLTTLGNMNVAFGFESNKTVELPEVTSISCSTDYGIGYYAYGTLNKGPYRLILPKVTTMNNNGYIFNFSTISKVYIGSDGCTMPANQGNPDCIFYVKADVFENYYLQINTWKNRFNANKMVGFLDYTDTIPTFSGYTDTWYEDEDCTTPIATTDFVSGNRYYVKLQSI